MKKTVLLILLIAGLVNVSNAQAPDWLWVGGTCLAGYQYGTNIFASPTGGIYVAGRLTGGASNLGGVTVNSPGTCAFNGKFTPSSRFVWANAYSYSTFDYLYGFGRDVNGNLYSTGENQGGGPTFWAQRCDSNGVKTWSVQAGGGRGFAINGDRWGNIYVAGMYGGSMTFGSTTLNSLGSEDIFMVKYNSAGVQQWAQSIGGSGDDRILRAIETDKDGNIYFSGSYTGTPTYTGVALPAQSGYENYYLAKYDSTGTPVWIKTVNSAGPDGSYDNGVDLKLDSTGNIYVTSTFQGTATFGSTTLTSAGGDDIFVGKLDNSGNWLWAKSAGGTSAREEGTGIALNKNADVYVIGIYQNTAKFGAITMTGLGVNKDNAFVAKYNGVTGNEMWVQTAGGASGDNNGYGITVDNNNYVYVTGDFAVSSTFGNNTLTVGYSGDLYIARLDTLPFYLTAAKPDSAYCPGSTGSVAFTTNQSFGTGNVFTAQLSDSTGSFVSPVTIGVQSGTDGGSVSVTIPGGTPTGKNYKIRIISSNPLDTDYSYSCVHARRMPVFTPGNTSITIGGGILTTSADTTVCSGSTVQLTVSGGSGTYVWSSVNNLSCSSCANPVVTVNTTDTIKVSSANGGCNATGSVIIKVGGGNNGGQVTAARDTICSGTPGSLLLAGNSSDSIRWQISTTDTNSFVNIGTTASMDTTKYRTDPLTQSTWFRAIVGTGSCTAASNSLQLIVPPTLTASFTSTTTGKTVTFNSGGSIGNINNYFWDFGDGNTSNDSNPVYTYAKDTIYNPCLTIYDGSNCSYTFCRTIALGIPTISADGSWLIYPNPFSNELSIDTKTFNNGVQSIVMYDVLGRVMINKVTGNAANSSYNLNTSLLANGMYYLVIKTTNANYVQKVVKQ